MLIAGRYQRVIEYFQEAMPNPTTELHYHNPYQLLVAVILSAQCTDRRVNAITPALFEAFPTVADMAKSSELEVLEYISSCSYPNSKAGYLVGAARMIVDSFGGEVPSSLEELMRLPGVGRKTANVVLSVAFDIPALPVDTHVFRVAKRLGLTPRAKTPEQAEQRLTRGIPRELWSKAHHWLILHGRYVCVARKPKCQKCGLAPICPSLAENLR